MGTYYFKQRFELGLLATEPSNWHFGIAPEVDVMIPVGMSSSFTANFKYNYAAASGEDVRGESTAVQYYGFNIGFAFYNDIF